MFGSKWGFPRRPNLNNSNSFKSEDVEPKLRPTSTLPDESFDVGGVNDSTIFLTKEELSGKFGMMAANGELGCKKVEILDAMDSHTHSVEDAIMNNNNDEVENIEKDRCQTLTSLSPPSTTSSSETNTESQRFWINCLTENGVLDTSPAEPVSLAPAFGGGSPVGQIPTIHRDLPSNNRATKCCDGASDRAKSEIFVSTRASEVLSMDEADGDIASILSSKLSYSPSSTAVSASNVCITLNGVVDGAIAREQPQKNLSHLERLLTEGEEDEEKHNHGPINPQPSEDSGLGIKPLPSDITLKTKKTACTEASDESSDRGKEVRSGSISTNTSPCSLDQLMAKLMAEEPTEQVHLQEHFQSDTVNDITEHQNQRTNQAREFITSEDETADDDAPSDEGASPMVDRLEEKLADMSFTSCASAPASPAQIEKEVDTSIMTTLSAPTIETNTALNKACIAAADSDADDCDDDQEYAWAYEVWKNMGLMKTTSPGKQQANQESAAQNVSIKSTNENSLAQQHKEVHQPKPRQSEELIDPQSLVTPTDSQAGFKFAFDDDITDQSPKPAKQTIRDRQSFPLTRPSVKKIKNRESFSHVMAMWKKNDDKPNSHFLSPEQNLPAEEAKALNAEKRAAFKESFDYKNAVKMKLVRQPPSQHATLVSVTSMVSTVSSYNEKKSINELETQRVQECDTQSTLSISESRSFMTTDSGSAARKYGQSKSGEAPIAQKRSPPVRGTSVESQLMMPQAKRNSSGGRSRSRRSSNSRRPRRLSDGTSNPSTEASAFATATSPRDHFRRNISPPKSRSDYKAVVQTFLGQVNEHEYESNTTNIKRAAPKPEDVFECINQPASTTTSMDSYQLRRQIDQELESSSSFGTSSCSWRFDSLSYNQNSFDGAKSPFGSDAADARSHADHRPSKSRGIVTESRDDVELDMRKKTSPLPPLSGSRVTPRPRISRATKQTKAIDADKKFTDDSPWTKQIVKSLEEAQSSEMHDLSPKEADRPWRSDLVFERVRQVGDNQSTIMSENSEPGKCNCASSVFSGNDELIEFFLPQMGMACTCGARPTSLANAGEPTALENILRPWQVHFLEGFGIHRGDQLVKAHHRSGAALATALRQYRRKREMTPFRTKSCGMALQIWSKTCKAYVRSIRKQLTTGTTELRVPNTLYILSSFLERMHDQTQREAAEAAAAGGATTPPAASTLGPNAFFGAIVDVDENFHT